MIEPYSRDNQPLFSSKISPTMLAALSHIVGEENAISSGQALEPYCKDETEDLRFRPALVLLPKTVEEVSEILRICHNAGLSVTPRGAGSGLAGGALPVRGGVVLSLERMNQILEIDERNLQVTTEAGVITQVLQEAVAAKGLYYPPDPASRGWSFIGGNISTNAGGPHAVKYGVVKDYVLNLEVVLPGGKVIWTGANTLKNSTGYNLTQLIVGSEGTLGIVTKAVLKLIPLPQQSLLMLAPFRSLEGACAAVSAIFQAGITPSVLEFMERSAIEKALEYLGDIQMNISEDTAAHLLIEVDGNHLESLYEDCEKINQVLEQFDCIEVLFADSQAQKDELWKLRRNTGHATKMSSIYKEEDTVVPRAELPKLIKGVKAIGEKYGFESVCYGHAGDGNLHVNILKNELSEDQWNKEVPKGIREIFELVKTLKGTLSGEHGIGYVQRDYMDVFFDETYLQLMRSIKKAFDPKGIMNPFKILK
jgi:glycolate oxidase